MKDIIKLTFVLTVVAVVSAAALSATYILTAPKIAEQKEKETKAALTEVLPKADVYYKKAKNVKGEKIEYFEGKVGDEVVGVVILISPTGYAGPIEMLVGIDTSGTVTGTKILSLIETPGLGLNAKSPAFLSQFKGKTSADKLRAKMDVDALTGATITTQAIADGVREAIKLSGSVL